MRQASDMPPPRDRRRLSRRLRVVISVGIAAVIISMLSLRGIAGFYTDYLWFDSLGYTSVWRGVLVAQVLLALVFILAMFVLLWVNLYLADRIAPSFRPPGPEEEFVKRYHDTVGARAGMVRIGVAALFALFWGAGAGSRWQDWILYRNGVDFGIEDPQFGVDIGFYVFELPFIRFVINWLFTAFVVVLIITAAAHYLNGGIRVNAGAQRVTPQVKRHLSVLLAGLALIKAADYWYQRYSLNFSNRGVVGGASYTDVNAQLPAIKLLILISLAAAVLLIVNIFRQGWILPVVAVGLWAFVAIVMGNIYPAIYQRLVVEPNELARERVFIDRNIIATRAAYGFSSVDEDGQTLQISREVFNFDPDVTEENFGPLSPQFLANNADTLINTRLLDPGIVSPTYSRLEVERDQFRFATDLDVDRYEIDGEDRLVVVAARELNLSGVRSGWENQHVSFTHGYGLAIAPANAVTGVGEPNFLVSSLPTAIDDSINVGLGENVSLQPRIYIGEGLGGYAIVNTERCEVDFPLQGGAPIVDEDSPDVDGAECPTGGSNQEFRYDGADGVEAGGLVRRLAFALRFQDLNPIFSGLIGDDAKFIYNRDVQTRVRELAPFLDFDADSYPAIIDGRVVFIIDAYTTTNNYPYAQNADRSSLPTGSDLRSSFNYVRNSVKVVVDAYNGNVDFFVVDETDPIIQAYQKAFPDLFKSREDAAFTQELKSHLRYPEDLFRIQTNMWATYQLTAADSFFDDTAAWSVALDPGSDLVATLSTTTGADGLAVRTNGDRIPPYYLQMRLPGEAEQEFVLMRPFVPSSRSGEDQRQELTAFMAGRIDDEGNQSLVSYTVPGTAVDGPILANAAMLNSPDIAERTTLLGQTGSSVRLGNMILLPLDDDNGEERILYVRPLYVDAEGGLPLLRLVIVAYDDAVRMCPTLELALGALFVAESDLDEDCNGVVSPLSGEPTAVADPPGTIDTPEPTPDPAPAPTPTPQATPDAGPTPTPPPVVAPPADVQSLLGQAQTAFDSADEALAEGDLGRYQDLIDEGQALLDQALALIATADEPAAAPEPSPVPTPTPSPEGA
jgi:uncharacterized membrane protein (UPF0182 family)